MANEGDRLDPRFEATGAHHHRDRAEGGLRPQDRPATSRARPRAAGLQTSAAEGADLGALRGLLRGRVEAFPDLSGRRLLREIRDQGYGGGYTAVTDFLRGVRPKPRPPFERRFETPAGRQAQVDFAEFKVEFADEPGIVRKVWLFSLVLGHSRWLWGRFCASQDLQTVLRCHIAAFAAIGGATAEVLYDRMKTAVIGEDEAGVVTFSARAGHRTRGLRRRPPRRGLDAGADRRVNSGARCNTADGCGIRLSPNRKAVLPCQDTCISLLPKGIGLPSCGLRV